MERSHAFLFGEAVVKSGETAHSEGQKHETLYCFTLHYKARSTILNILNMDFEG